MKATVPNKDGMGSKSGSSTCSLGSTKEPTKLKLEKELEDIIKKLGNNAKGNKKGPEYELKLLEQKVYVMLKLKQWKEVLEEGYKVLGKKGPNVIIYKCILVSLCRIGKFDDDVVELLNHWKAATPKCSQMSETRRKMDGYLTAIRSGINATILLQNIEEVLGLNSDFILSTNSITESEPNWRFRAPPQRHNTFSICTRVTSGSTCIYGDECLLAHSKEELKEWQFRSQWNSKKGLPDCSLESLRSLKSTQSSNPSIISGVREPIPPTYRLLPPACMYYLLGLVKKVKEADNIKTILVDNLADVRIKFTSPLELIKPSGSPSPISHKWSFMVAAKQPLATVTLLHDVNREHFGITSAFFFNSKKEPMDLVDMHPNNKSQKVLNTFIRPDVFLPFNNGWPEWCCYQVDVIFQSSDRSAAIYEQNIVFDFKNDPKVAKRLSVTVEPPPQPQNYIPKAIMQRTGSNNILISGSNGEASSDTDENNSVADELEGMSDGDSVKNISQDPWDRKSVDTEPSKPTPTVSKTNVDAVISETNFSSRQQVGRNISSIESENSRNLNISLDNMNLKMANYIASMRKISMDNYQLLTCSKRKLDIWMSLDSKYFDIIGDILRDRLKEYHYQLLFPEVPEPKLWDLSSLMTEFEHPKKLDQNLNSKQKQAFCAILKQTAKQASPHSSVIIVGPHSSGKSYTIAHSALGIVTLDVMNEQMKRVLICTYSNEAADKYISDYFKPLAEEFTVLGCASSLLRIYYTGSSVTNVADAVKEHCLLTEDGMAFRNPTIDEIYSHQVIIVTLPTCVELVKLGLRPDTFSCIFIDEATQMMEIESVCPIALAGPNTNLVLAGDVNLLGTEMYSLENSLKMNNLSLLHRLNDLYPNNNPSRIILQETYRMHKDIVQFVSTEFYSSSLVCTESQPPHPRYFPLCFSTVVGEDSVADTGEGYFNMKEILEIRDRVIDLIGAWPSSWESPKSHSIAVITSYAAQATGLKIRLKLDGLSFVDVLTVPDSLAKQYRVVLISPVRTFRGVNTDVNDIKESYTEYGFFSNTKAVNTAFTRAQSLIIVVGDLVGLCNFGKCRYIWREYVSLCRRNHSLMGIKYLESNKVETAPTIVNEFDHSTYNIPLNMLNKNFGAGDDDGRNSFNLPLSNANTFSPLLNGDFMHASAKNITPLQNSNDLNVQSGMKNQLRKDTAEEMVRTSKSCGKIASIWDSVEDISSGNINKPSISHASIWNSYPDAISIGSLTGIQSIWNTEASTTPAKNSESPTFGNSGINMNVNSYRSPFDLPDVRLMETVKPSKFALAPGCLGVHTNDLGIRFESEPSGTSTHLGSNPFFGIVSSVANNNKEPIRPLCAMQPIGPPSHRQSHQPQTYNSYETTNNSFHMGSRPRSTFVLPPRMLRAANSATHSGVSENFNARFTKEPSKDFDFFSELGLHNGKEDRKTPSSSSASSSRGSTDLTSDQNFLSSSTEFPQLSPSSDWVQVKSSKKSKTASQKQGQQKKSKKKSKNVGDNDTTASKEPKELTVEQKIQNLMEMGFEKRQVIKALQACDKDLQRSVDWLILYAPAKKDQKGT